MGMLQGADQMEQSFSLLCLGPLRVNLLCIICQLMSILRDHFA